MANKQIILTFHQLRERCQQGSAEGWRVFFNLYGALGLKLLAIYAPGDSASWEETVEALTRENFERFRAMPQQSEREFLVELRTELLQRALAKAGADGSAAAAPSGNAADIDLERMARILEGLPLLHQEIVWFKMAGYTDATIERMLRVTPAMARSALGRVAPNFGAIGELAEDRSPWPRAWLALLGEARAAQKEDCPTLHQLLRIHDGQVSWYDKEPVEKRVSGCPHCLENWTGLREVGYWRLAAPAVSGERVEQWLQRVPVTEAKKKSLLQRSSS